MASQPLGGKIDNLHRVLLTMSALSVLFQCSMRACKAYKEEISSGSKPIEGVGTAIAAFIGLDAHRFQHAQGSNERVPVSVQP